MSESGRCSMKIKDFSLRIDEDLLKKLHYVADYEGRSANMEIKQLVKKHIASFEKEHGKIELEMKKKSNRFSYILSGAQ